MIVDLRNIDRDANFRYVLDQDHWRSDAYDEQVLGLDSPLDVEIRISSAADRYVLEGHVSGGLRIRCDRCLEPYRRDLDTGFRIFMTASHPDGDSTEAELIDEDMEVEFLQGDEVDLDEIVREQIFLSLPMKLVCREGCRGLCPQCGADLNKGKCNCGREGGHPGFSKLKNLVIEKP
ncbi:MAG: YceD family protein [Desulfatiglandales bacterium]